MEECIFCKIARNEVEYAKIWENAKFVAFLDIAQAVKGQALVIPKEHLDSDLYNNRDEDISEAMLASKEVAKLLQTKLGVERVITIIEGLEVNHLHIKLYPYKAEKDEGFPGYSFVGGKDVTPAELHEIKREIVD
jgi:histidine triad (HIT) family protein